MEDGLRLWYNMEVKKTSGLNPCCNGRWSQTSLRKKVVLILVLILVVMEDGLRRLRIFHEKIPFVLILVVMEDGLRHSLY